MSTPARPAPLLTDGDALDAELAKLRRVGYQKAGNWTLGQIATHLRLVLNDLSKPAADDAVMTPEQAALCEKVFGMAQRGEQITAQPRHLPPDQIDDGTACNQFLSAYRQFERIQAKQIDFGPFGPLPREQAFGFHLGHAATHLAFLKPNRRDGLRYETIDHLIADLKNLRDNGHLQAGNWTLAQNAWHIDNGVKRRLQPGPHPADTEYQVKMAEVFRSQILPSGELPPGLKAPPEMMPPKDVPSSAVDDLIATLGKVKTHTGFAPHRLFGLQDDELSRRQILIHAANHLRNLIPQSR